MFYPWAALVLGHKFIWKPFMAMVVEGENDMAFMAYVKRRTKHMQPDRAALVQAQMIKDRAIHEARLAGYAPRITAWAQGYRRAQFWRLVFAVLLAISLFAGLCRYSIWHESIYRPAHSTEWNTQHPSVWD